jgi:hypothetical protein
MHWPNPVFSSSFWIACEDDSSLATEHSVQLLLFPAVSFFLDFQNQNTGPSGFLNAAGFAGLSTRVVPENPSAHGGTHLASRCFFFWELLLSLELVYPNTADKKGREMCRLAEWKRGFSIDCYQCRNLLWIPPCIRWSIPPFQSSPLLHFVRSEASHLFFHGNLSDVADASSVWR